MALFNANDFNFAPNATNSYLQNLQTNNSVMSNNTGNGSGFGGGLGFNMDTAKLALGGIQTLGNLWNAWQAQSLARDQFDFTKGITETNLVNSIKSYNTSIEDRIRARGAVEGQSQGQIDDYLNRNRVAR